MNNGPFSLIRVDGNPNLAKCAFSTQITAVVVLSLLDFPPAAKVVYREQVVFAVPIEQEEWIQST